MPAPRGSFFAPPKIPPFRRNLWLLLAACLLLFTEIGAQALLLNLYLVALGFRADFLGLYTFANTAGIGVAALFAGRVTNRVGCRKTLIGSSFILAVSSGGLVLLDRPLDLLVLAVINGASLAHVFVPCATFVMDNVEPRERSAAYAGYFTAQSLAMVVGSLLGGVLPGLFVAHPESTPVGYGFALVVGAVVAGLGVIPLTLADDSRASGSHAYQTEVQTATGHRKVRRDIIWLTATNGVVATALGFGVPFLNVYFSERLGVSTGDMGLIFALGSAAMVVASIAGPAVAARLGSVPTVVLFRFLTVPIFVALGLSGTVPVAAGLYVLRILLTNLTWPVDNAFSMELVPPTLRATMAGLRSASWNLAWAVSSVIAGLLIVDYGFLTIFIAAGVFMAIGCLVYYGAFRAPAPAPSGSLVATPAALPD